jgi:hypothetical protein
MYIIYIYVYHVSLALQTSLRAQEAFVNGQKQGVEWELEHVLRAKAQLQAQLQVCPYVSFICVLICVLICMLEHVLRSKA